MIDFDLNYSIFANDYQTVKKFLESRYFNSIDIILHLSELSVVANVPEIFELILSYNPKININHIKKNISRDTISLNYLKAINLYEKYKTNQIKIFEMILQKNKDVFFDIDEYDGFTPIYHIIFHNDKNSLLFYLKSFSYDEIFSNISGED